MGNSLGGKKTTKVMKISGETFKLKTPVKAHEVIKDYPGHVVLESEAVKHFGVRAKPLEPNQSLEPKRLYFLVELPNCPNEGLFPRRVRSGINISAKDRLESLKLSRRSASDLSIMKSRSAVAEGSPETGAVRVRMRLPKAEVERLMRESRDEEEAAEKIVDLCMGNNDENGKDGLVLKQQVHWKDGHGRARKDFKSGEKRVSFMPISEGGSQIAVAS